MTYILVYGFRRYAACKKLGWKTIPAYLKNQDKTITLNISDIELVEKNTRLYQDDDSFHELMQSIKENGLLQPVGISDPKDITKDEFLTSNLIENVHRQDISPFELSRACGKLVEEGLTIGQIAVRLSQPKTRIAGVMRLAEEMGDDLELTSFGNSTIKERKGKIPFSIMNTIAQSKMGSPHKRILVEYVRQHDLSIHQVLLVKNLVNNGMGIEEALKNVDDFVICNPTVIVRKDLLEQKEFKTMPNSVWLNKMLSGEIELDTNLFYYTR